MTKLLLSLILSLFLASCGGGSGGAGDSGGSGGSGGSDGSDGSGGTLTDLSGKVIDGYISGAMVFLDLNFNGVKDANEPSTVSVADGDFSFGLTDSELECASYVPTVVDVPVGAVDAEFGEVTEAYQMVLPPTFEPVSGSDSLNISPITSLVWNAIETLSTTPITELSCDVVKADQSKRDATADLLSAAISDVVRHYNLSEEQLFIDFIAEDNSAVKEVAVKAVKGLQKSLVETALLQEQYPNASWAKVNYYFFSSIDGDDLYPNAWYRELQLYNGDTIAIELIKVSDDLSNEIRPILYEKTTVSSTGGINLREEIGYESRGGDDSPYNCSYKEEVSLNSGVTEYQLVNLGSQSNVVGGVEACKLPDFSAQSMSRYIFYNSTVFGIGNGAQFTFSSQNGDFSALNNWTNLVDNIATLQASELVNYVESLPYGFCQSGDAGADFINRSRVETIDGDEIVLDREQNGNLTRTTRFADGTSKVESSTIASAPSWDYCAQVDTDGDGSPDQVDPDDDNDGVSDLLDAFPLDFNESVDTDGDSVGNNADTDDDNDLIADINDQYPLDPGNILDSDGDGVVDRDDIDPNDSNVSGAMQVDFSGADALALGSVIDRDTVNNQASLGRQIRQEPSFLRLLATILFPEAWANDVVFESLTNALGWNADGDLVADTLLSNETKFIAEAAVSPDGRYLYLLTSAHIQRALANMDQESCSIYRVTLSTNSHSCLLKVVQGDVQPRSLNSALRFDNSRGGMVFRADGAALIHGFNWERLNAQPEPCECASGSVWFMSPEGVITDLPRDVGWEAATATWINDELFAVPESNYDNQSGGQERIAVYSAETLERTQFIEGNDANGAVLSLLRMGGSVYWKGRNLNAATFEISNNNFDGYPVVDQTGQRLFYFNEDGSSKRSLISDDGAISLELVADGAESYNWQEQSGVGTDIKYTPLAFAPDHIGFMKVFPPDTPIKSIEGVEWAGGGTSVVLSDSRGSLALHGMNTLQIFPSSGFSGNLQLDYVVETETSTENRSLVIPAAVFTNWRADDDAADHINWALPESEIEGFCVYAYQTEAMKCMQFADYDVLAFDLESDRSTRYDDDAVCPDGSCNAFPGVSNIILVDDILRVYFKDSEDHKYYEAKASIVDFMVNGESAMTFSSAENGAGEVNIIAAANKLVPFEPLPLSNVTIAETSPQVFKIDFGQSLSKYAALPSFEIWNGSEVVPLAREDQWSTSRDSVTLHTTSKGLIVGAEHEVRITGPIFLVDSTRRYEPSEQLKVTSSGINAFKLSGTSVVLDDYDPSSQATTSAVLDVVVANSSMAVDLSASPLSLENMTNATSGGDFRSPTLRFALSQLPVGEGSADVTIDLVDGEDSVRGDGERRVFVELTADWTSDGIAATITIPQQTVKAFYETSGGTKVDVEVDNLDSDILTVTSAGANYPSTLDVKLLSALKKVESLSPASLLSEGTFTVTVETSLPIVDSNDNLVTELRAVVQIGE